MTVIERHITGQLHYRCDFEVETDSTVDGLWQELTRMIRQWITDTPKHAPPTLNDAFWKAWFFLGGDWRPPQQPGYSIKTARELGNGTDQVPEHWAVAYEHPCSSPGRIWQTNIGLSLIGSNRISFSILTLYFMRRDFIGREPEQPVPTAPRIVTRIVESQQWRAFAGSRRLAASPQILNVGDGESFRQLLSEATARCPIILLSRRFSTGAPLLDAGKLAWLLSGAAVVYESVSSDVDKELEWCLGRRFSCWNGMIRVYQSPVHFDQPFNAARHRYLSADDIERDGAVTAVEVLVRGIARRNLAAPAGIVTTVTDIASIERERRLAELRGRTDDAGRAEWTAALEERNGELEGQNKTFSDQLSGLQERLAELQDQLDESVRKCKYEASRAIAAEKSVRLLHAESETVATLAKLPTDIVAAARLVGRLKVSRIVFTDAALASAKDSDFDDVKAAWECFWNMATTLHDLFFKEGVRETGDKETAFKNACGYELAMTEGEQTKKDADLMKLRRKEFRGKEIDVTPHVKLDKNTTRAYFSLFSSGEERLIVVAHIGHLKTAGTRRMRT